MTSCKFRKDVRRMVTYSEVIVVQSSIPHSIPMRLLDIVLLGSVRQLICTVCVCHGNSQTTRFSFTVDSRFLFFTTRVT